jgi:hypothetical protein
LHPSTPAVGTSDRGIAAVLPNMEIPMIQPDGRETLAIRRSYLRRRRGGRGVVALWVTFGLLVAWLGIVGLAGLTH